MARRTVVIIGALGMDFHTFNTAFRDNEKYDVKAFTYAAEQNVGTTGTEERRFPAALAGKLYPEGIPMIPETQLEEFVRTNKIDECVFAYSDCSHPTVMHKASRCLANGADYRLIAPRVTQIKSNKPIVGVCAVRTGCGKSQASRTCLEYFRKQGYKVVAIREPMPYGDLVEQTVMRFATYDDFKKHGSTVEEREEYEPYIEQGMVIYSGVDYQKIIEEAEKEADIIIWDGGNNEISFYQTDLLFIVVDPLRPGHEMMYHPGEVNARIADVFIVNKVSSVKNAEDLKLVQDNCTKMNPKATQILTDMVVSTEKPELVKGKKVIVVEDGPTLTHGEMGYGAGTVAAQNAGATIVDPKPYLQGAMKKVYEEFPHLVNIVPAMGYTQAQLDDLKATLNAIPADIILNGSPIDLAKLMECNKPIVRVTYDIAPTKDSPPELTMQHFLQEFEKKHLKK